MEDTSLRGKRVFLTGATGFVGGHLARRLLSLGAHVRALARRPPASESGGIAWIQGDLTDPRGIDDAVAGTQVVFHVAAKLSGPEHKMRAVNVDGTRRVVEAAIKAGVERFVHVSTIAVYGYRHCGEITEDLPLGPTGEAYGDTKAAAEAIVRWAGRERGLPFVIVRPGMIYGPSSAMWTVRINSLTALRPTPMPGDGSGTCPLIYVGDLVNLMLILAAHPAALGEVFNAVMDPPPTWRDYLGAHVRMHGHNRLLPVPSWLLKFGAIPAEILLRVRGDRRPMLDMVRFSLRRVRYSMDKARDILGWSPEVTLEDGMARCEAWLRTNGYLSREEK